MGHDRLKIFPDNLNTILSKIALHGLCMKKSSCVYNISEITWNSLKAGTARQALLKFRTCHWRLIPSADHVCSATLKYLSRLVLQTVRSLR